MTTRPVQSLVDDQIADLIMPAGADIAAALGLPRETLVQNLPRRMAADHQERLEVPGGAP